MPKIDSFRKQGDFSGNRETVSKTGSLPDKRVHYNMKFNTDLLKIIWIEAMTKLINKIYLW